MTEDEYKKARETARCRLALYLGAVIGREGKVPPMDLVMLKIDIPVDDELTVSFGDLMLAAGVTSHLVITP